MGGLLCGNLPIFIRYNLVDSFFFITFATKT